MPLYAHRAERAPSVAAAAVRMDQSQPEGMGIEMFVAGVYASRAPALLQHCRRTRHPGVVPPVVHTVCVLLVTPVRAPLWPVSGVSPSRPCPHMQPSPLGEGEGSSRGAAAEPARGCRRPAAQGGRAQRRAVRRAAAGALSSYAPRGAQQGARRDRSAKRTKCFMQCHRAA